MCRQFVFFYNLKRSPSAGQAHRLSLLMLGFKSAEFVPRPAAWRGPKILDFGNRLSANADYFSQTRLRKKCPLAEGPEASANFEFIVWPQFHSVF
jgi:hypothetical protein